MKRKQSIQREQPRELFIEELATAMTGGTAAEGTMSTMALGEEGQEIAFQERPPAWSWWCATPFGTRYTARRAAISLRLVGSTSAHGEISER